MASAAMLAFNWGQQIWCDARADGHSPDERDRLPKVCAVNARTEHASP
jgi:hypothetical protein